MDVTYNNKTISFPLNGEKVSFRVASGITCGINVASDDQNKQSLFINNPIYVTIVAKSIDGQTAITQLDPPNIPNLTLKFNNVNLPIYFEGWETPIQVGNNLEYIYKFIYPNPGTLDSSATVTFQGVKGSCSLSNLKINPNKVIANFIDMPGCIQPSVKTIHIITKDSLGNFINTQNILTVTDLNGVTKDISNLIINDSIGNYHFDYNFITTGGEVAYSFDLISSSQGLDSNDPLIGAVTVSNDCNGQCTINSDCAIYGDYICNSYQKCVPKSTPINYLLYIGIGLGLIFVIIIIFILIKLRKPRNNFYTGLEGL